MESNIYLTAEELDLQLNGIIDFLSIVHPSLTGSLSTRPCIEIRPILRGKKDYKLSRSLNIWDLSDKSISRLKSFLKLHNGQPSCLYYSVYSFDNQMETKTKRGTAAVKGKISSNSALFTNEIVLDFDDINEKEFISLSERISALDIKPLWVFTGHGYQAHILLNEQTYDKHTLFYMVHLFRSKGFYADENCTDAARVMRLPETFNCKCFNKDKAYENELTAPPKCVIEKESSVRYTLQDVVNRLQTLPTISKVDEDLLTALFSEQNAMAETAAASDECLTFSKEISLSCDQIMVLNKLEYPFINQFAIPAPISKMLAHTPLGYRNKVLGFLIRYFKVYLKLSKEQIYKILSIWARSACEPAFDDFNIDFSRIYSTYNGFKYDSTLTKKFGYIDFENLIELRKQDIVIPNHFFEEFPTLDGKMVRAYLAIRLLEHIGKTPTQESLSKLLHVSERALRPTLQALIKTRHVYLVEGNRTKKIPHEYHSTKIFASSNGSQVFSYNDIKAYITELFEDGNRGNGELKLYLFMRYKFYTGEIYMAQDNLGRNIGLKQNSISVLTKKLEEKYFISITRNYFTRTLFSCVYSLLR